MFTSGDLRWVKNVKRDQGSDWAYQEYEIGDFFWLNWSSQFKGSVLKADVGELILIFQTLNDPKGTFLTHLVTPKDKVLKYDSNSRHPHIRRVCIVAKADPIDSTPKLPELDFKRPNRGATCRIQTIISMDTKKVFKLSKIQNIIFGQFENIDVEMDRMIDHVLQEGFDDEEYEEGEQKEVMRKHKYYERSGTVISEAKRNAKTKGRFFCEVCKFNFETNYDPIGQRFIECHHKTPIATGGKRKTSVKNLAIVCSNCHRMLHRKESNGAYPTINRLKQIVKNNRV
ncbi:hypothetical protein ES705_05021 [subsurface metagenome]